MPFISLPDRTTGQILSASYLNQLSDNVEWLYGAGGGRNLPFQGYAEDVVDTVDITDVYWYFRHRLTYLHYNITIGGEADYLRIKVSDGATTTTVFANETPGAARTFTSSVDVSALTMHQWYQLWVEIDFVGPGNSVHIALLCESDTTTFGTQTASSYAAPPRWERGGTVTAARMNLYKTALDSIHASLADEQYNLPVRQNNTEDRGFYFVNRYRWLHYIGDGELVDLPGGGENALLTGNGANIVVYDLLNVEWMTPGLTYQVEDCVFACEDYLP